MGSIPTAPVFFKIIIILAVVAKWLTHRIVIPTFGGSIPLVRPILLKIINTYYYTVSDHNMAVVAKWLTHRIVIPTFGGSIPLVRPISGV